MGFFAEFSAWLNGLLSTYIATNTVRIAGVLEPVVVTLAVLYVMIWGYLQLTGKIEEPFIVGIRRLITLSVILGVALNLWLYNDVIVDSFFNAPAQLGASIVGAYDPVGTVDQIIDSGSDTGGMLLQKGGILNGNFAFYLAGIAVYLVVGITAIYTIFLLSLSHIALSILLAIGPLFIALTLFDTTKRFFEAWIAQLSNYAFITVLTVLASALMLTVLSTAAAQAVAQGGGITIAMAARVCMASGLTFLIMRQVMPMASGLASGISLNTFGWMSLALGWGLGRAKRHSGDFIRGLGDRDTSRWDSYGRKAGHYTRTALASGWRKAVRRDNHIRAA